MLWAEFSPLSKSQGNLLLFFLLLVISPMARPYGTVKGDRIILTCMRLFIYPSIQHFSSISISIILDCTISIVLC